tara:strand:- start:67 stop:432 length:366 start_codon:yes stop_codon:yes gene_type:complete
MATLTPTLTLTSTDATSDSLSITVTDTLTVDVPVVNMSEINVLHTGATNILTSAANTSITYVYLKNADSTNIITVKADDATAIMDLGPLEFAFFPVKGAVGLEAQANVATCKLEYGYWTKS